jgi:hypothetical protein
MASGHGASLAAQLCRAADLSDSDDHGPPPAAEAPVAPRGTQSASGTAWAASSPFSTPPKPKEVRKCSAWAARSPFSTPPKPKEVRKCSPKKYAALAMLRARRCLRQAQERQASSIGSMAAIAVRILMGCRRVEGCNLQDCVGLIRGPAHAFPDAPVVRFLDSYLRPRDEPPSPPSTSARWLQGRTPLGDKCEPNTRAASHCS